MKNNHLGFTIVVVIAIVVLTLNNYSNHAFLRSTLSSSSSSLESTEMTSSSSSTPTTAATRIPSTSVTTCPLQSIPNLREQKLSKSQSGEDFVLLRWFNGLCHGTYIELGALDGIKFSNSYLFEFAMQWRGLLIEITPPSFHALQHNRPNNVLVHAGVCEQRQIIHYYNDTEQKTAVTGIVEFAAEHFRKRWWPNLKDDWSNSIEMECIPLQEIIDEHYVPALLAASGKATSTGGGARNTASTADDNSYTSTSTTTSTTMVHFDFLSLDVEGAEDQVLRSIDYSKVSFGILLLEADEYNERKNLAIRVFLESQGYLFLRSEQRSYWFVHKHFDQIYRHVLHR